MKQTEALPRNLIHIALLLVLGIITPMLDSTMVNIALNDLAASFHTSLEVIQWITSGYTLAMAVSVPFSGYLVKRFDGKNVFLLAELGFLISSLCSGISGSIGILIVFRVIQGFSAGIIMPLVTTLLIQAAGQRSLGRLISIVGMPLVLGPIIGPVIGGIIVEYLSWHWIFFVNIPIGIIVIFLLYTQLPAFPPENAQTFLDLPGILMLSLLSASFIYGISSVSKGGLFNERTILFVSAGIILTVLYLLYAGAKKEAAIVPLRLFRHRNFTASFAGLFFAGTVINGPMLLFPLFFQNERQYTVILAGLAMIPQGIGMLLARSYIGRMTDEIGAKYVVIVSTIITVIGTLPFIWISGGTSYLFIAIALLIRGIGVGGVSLPMMTDSYVGLEKQQVAEASTATRVIQNIGGAFGSAVLATVIAGSMNGKETSIAAYTNAYHLAFAVACVLSAILFVPAIFLTNHWKHKA